MYLTAVTEGFVWSLLWIIYVYIIVTKFPWQMLHDYPEDIQKASTLPEPTKKQKRKARSFAAAGSLVIFGTLTAFGLAQFRGGKVPFMTVLTFVFIIAMIWNLVDLLIMDWLIICCITPKWVVIEGTERCKGYHDYFYHFKGFLIGCVYTALTALAIAGIDYLILGFLVWR